MKAVLHTKFGPPDELQIKAVEKPTPRDNEVLIKIRTKSITSTDGNAFRCLTDHGFEKIEVIKRDPYPEVEYASRRSYVFAVKPES